MDEVAAAMMKVTVTFGQTGVVVPCKEGWTVRDLIQQATQRYKKLLEQVRAFGVGCLRGKEDTATLENNICSFINL